MPWRQCLGSIEGKSELEIEWLLAPQRAVIVESRDALRREHEVRAALRRHPRDEIDDGFLDRTVVPGGQGIGLSVHSGMVGRNKAGRKNENQKDSPSDRNGRHSETLGPRSKRRYRSHF